MPPPDPELPQRLADLDQEAGDLTRNITRVRRLPPDRRAREARRLATEAERILSRLADAAVVEATGSASWDAVAGVLGTSTASVGKAIRRYKGQAFHRGPRRDKAAGDQDAGTADQAASKT